VNRPAKVFPGSRVPLTKKLLRAYRAECKTFSSRMEPQPLPADVDAHTESGTELLRHWRSRKFSAMLFRESSGRFRLTVHRTEIDTLSHDRWKAGITWDSLQKIKRECGFGDSWCVECYPPDHEVQDVQNMRHLWVLIGDEPPEFGWSKARSS
jgi:hypothetical protein